MGMLRRMFVIISDYPTTARVQRGGVLKKLGAPSATDLVRFVERLRAAASAC